MDYVLDILKIYGVFSILTISQNFLVGNTGFNFIGQIAFFAIGAYSTAILSSTFPAMPLIGIVVGIGLNIVIAIVIGLPALRLYGHYLLIVSLGFCEIIRSIVNNSMITGGAAGITIKNTFLNSNFHVASYQLLLIIYLFLGLEVIFFYFLFKTPKGRLFIAMRDDNLLLTVLGRNTNKLKLQALIISAIWASVGGSLFAIYSRYIDPTSFTIQQALLLFVGILIGGIGSLKGSLFASCILIIVPILIRLIHMPTLLISSLHQILFAILVLIILKYKPTGFFGKIKLNANR